MKTTETTQNQTVRTSPNMVAKMRADVKMAQANDVDKEELAEVQADKPKDIEVIKKADKPTIKKVTKVRAESMEGLALRLRKEKANEATILKAFTVAYKAKGQADVKFIKPRVAIYLKIADKAIAASKPESKAKAKAS